MATQEDNKGMPNWVLFLFYGSLLIGGFYTIFLHGFLGYEPLTSYHMASSGNLYVQPKLAIVPARTTVGMERGKKNYAQVCVACHGMYGQYTSSLLGPNLADSEWLHDNSETKIAQIIQNGVSTAKSITKQVMPARGGSNLSNQAIWEIVYYLSSQNPSIVRNAKPTE